MASTGGTPESQPASIWNVPFPRDELGDLRAALECYERCVAIDEAAHGPDHPAVLEGRKAITGVLERLEP